MNEEPVLSSSVIDQAFERDPIYYVEREIEMQNFINELTQREAYAN